MHKTDFAESVGSLLTVLLQTYKIALKRDNMAL